MKKEIKKLLERPEVQIVGYGKKITNGIITDEDAIIVGVDKKLPAACLTKEEMIPKKIKTRFLRKKKTDVIEVEKIRAMSNNYNLGNISPDDRVKKWNTLQPGVSCGNFRITAGTLGAIVYTYDIEENN
ncbi:MAG TPA: hypothetical protein PKI83_03150, partial [Bacteroidales bacterium]|nr:hypothetical protein [Bacteroidales bacterium]